jgi:anti-sigma B factor antagonist
MFEIEIVAQKEEGRELAILRVQGDLDIEGSNKLLTALKDLEERKIVHILVDLGKVKFICSAGLGILISTLQTLKMQGGDLKLLNLKNGVREKFRITRLLEKFECYVSEEGAVKIF